MSSSSTLNRVFVYGTLKTRFYNNYILQDAKNGKAVFIGKGKTKETYPLVVSTMYKVPFLLNQPGVGYNVEGEIYDVDDSMLKMLDKLELRGILYDGIPINVAMETDHVITSCLCYVIDNYHDDLLELEHLKEYELGYHLSTYVPPVKRTGVPLSDLVNSIKKTGSG